MLGGSDSFMSRDVGARGHYTTYGQEDCSVTVCSPRLWLLILVIWKRIKRTVDANGENNGFKRMIAQDPANEKNWWGFACLSLNAIIACFSPKFIACDRQYVLLRTTEQQDLLFTPIKEHLHMTQERMRYLDYVLRSPMES